MAPTPSRIRTAFLGTLAALLCAAGLTTVTAPAARADVLTDVITDIEVSPLDPSPFEIIISTVQFCLPTGTSAGDTFRLTVSEELLLLPVDFEITSLPDGDGELVGSGDVVPVAGGGGTVTVTLTDYASTRRDVCGSFFFGARLADTSYANTNEVTYTYDDGVFVETVTTREGSVRTRRSPDKFSFFTRDDQGTDDVDGAIRFGIQTPLGPFDTATITDIPDAGDGFTFDCDSITVRGFRVQDDGSLLRHRTIDPLSLDCTPGALILEVGPLNRDDELIRVNVDASITAQLGVYMNTVTVQIDDLAERADSATLERVMAGGVAEGTNTPDITIVKLDEDGNDADTADDAADLGLAPGDTGLVFTITNSGDEPLVNVEVTDEVIANGTITGLDCTFPDDSTGTTWDGPFAVDDTFDCTADLTDVSADEVHHDIATVTGVGEVSGLPVDDDNPYHAVVDLPPTPEIELVKGDENGNEADTADDAADLGAAPGATGLVLTITNTGDEPLLDVAITDVVLANGTITGLDCTFPDDTTGTTWAGPLAVGASFDCTADLTDVSPDEVHHDVGTVTAVGEVSGLPVEDDNPYHAVADVPPTPPTPAPPITPRIETGTPVTGGGMRSPLLSLLGFVLLAGATMALPQLGRRPRRGGPLA